jgi:putative two-component system response regulator
MEQIAQSQEKILIIDSYPDAIRTLVAALPDGYSKVIATSGMKAFDLLAASPELPGLILLETGLPQQDGYKICALLKENPRYGDIPVIFLGEHSEIRDKVAGLQLGGVDFITIPFDPVEVRSRIETHLKIRALQLELERRHQDLEKRVEAKAQEILSMQQATIFALVHLTEQRDDGIGGHLERTRQLCAGLAARLQENPLFRDQIDQAFIDNLVMAAPLHDIGKVGIPDEIYLKPGRLTAGEFLVMQRHTLIGARALQQVLDKFPENPFIRMGIDIVRSHHEHWDGTGYPDGLRDEAIPLSARIVAVADVFDALRTIRPYKPAMNQRDSVAVICEGRGRHFDPAIVDAFLAIEPEIARLYPWD